MNITIKLSGHILFPKLGDAPDLQSYADAVMKVKAMGHRPFVVVGGGEPARYYIKIARENGSDESSCDQVGIAVANLNAKIFSRILGDDACQFVPVSSDDLDRALSTGRIVVMGGLQPGQSTNAVSGVLAERSRSKLLISTTTVDGVYSGDPKKNRDAKRYSRITVGELRAILDQMGTRAGEYDLLDPVALKIIERSGITAKVIDGRDPKNILRAIDEDIGTAVVP
jgi:uridylate kinase